VREQRVALGLDDVLVVVLENVVQALHVLAGHRLDHVAPVVGPEEAGVALAVGFVQGLHAVVRQRAQIGLFAYVEAFADVLENQGTVLFDFVMTRQDGSILF